MLLDVVIDEAEIPTFQATQASTSTATARSRRPRPRRRGKPRCIAVGRALTLDVGGSAAPLGLVEAGLAFPAGNGGLSTMRLVCTFDAPLAAPIAAGTPIAFSDGFEPSRIGWREVAVEGSGVTTRIAGRARRRARPAGSPRTRRVSAPHRACGRCRSRRRPAARPCPHSTCRTPTRSAPSTSRPRRSCPVVDIGAATPAGTATPRATGGASAGSSSVSSAASSTASVPGGEGAIPDILRSAPATPILALVALLTAAALGRRPRAHARPRQDPHGRVPRRDARDATPRGGPRDGRERLAHARHPRAGAGRRSRPSPRSPPDLVVRVAPLVAAVSIVVIGGWMLMTEVRRGIAARRATRDAHDHEHEHAHGAGHEHAHDAEHEHPHAHDHDAEHAMRITTASSTATAASRHRHVPRGRLDDQLALPVRPRSRRRPRPVGERAADPAGDDRRRPAGVGRRPRRRVRPRHGGGHDGRRPGLRLRPRRCSSARRSQTARRRAIRLVPPAAPSCPGGRRRAHDPGAVGAPARLIAPVRPLPRRRND